MLVEVFCTNGNKIIKEMIQYGRIVYNFYLAEIQNNFTLKIIMPRHRELKHLAYDHRVSEY